MEAEYKLTSQEQLRVAVPVQPLPRQGTPLQTPRRPLESLERSVVSPLYCQRHAYEQGRRPLHNESRAMGNVHLRALVAPQPANRYHEASRRQACAMISVPW